MVIDLEKLSKVVEALERMDIKEIERIQKAADILVYAENKVLTAADVGSIVGASAKAVGNWYEKGIIKGFKIGREYRFTQDDVKEFQESMKGCTVFQSGEVRRRFPKQQKRARFKNRKPTQNEN